MVGYSIARVGASDVSDLVPLMRAYCDFYHVAPTDEDLIALATALVDDPDHEGVQLIARDAAGHGAGFATVYWTWSTTIATRIGVMNDLFVAEYARGRGLADRLIRECRTETARRGARRLTWQRLPTTSGPRRSTSGSGPPASNGSTTGWPGNRSSRSRRTVVNMLATSPRDLGAAGATAALDGSTRPGEHRLRSIAALERPTQCD